MLTEANRKHCFTWEQSIAELNAAEKLELKLGVWLIRNDNTEVDNYQCRGGWAGAILEGTEMGKKVRETMCAGKSLLKILFNSVTSVVRNYRWLPTYCLYIKSTFPSLISHLPSIRIHHSSGTDLILLPSFLSTSAHNKFLLQEFPAHSCVTQLLHGVFHDCPEFFIWIFIAHSV